MDMSNHVVQTMHALSTSLYFWWIAYLRCSKDYWWICQQRGECQDERLVKVYEDFGNIYKHPNIMHWWLEHGVKLFDSPQIEMDFVKYLISGIEVLYAKDMVKPRPNMICLAIPMLLDPKEAIRAIYEAWHTARIRGKHYTVSAKYQLDTTNKRSLAVIVPCYRTWTLNICVTLSNKSDRIHSWGGFQMANQLHLSPDNEAKPVDSLRISKQKQSALRTQFSRNKTMALAFIENVEIGRFPCKEPVIEQPRWNEKQLKERDQAVQDGAWQSPSWLSREYSFLLPEREMKLDYRNTLNDESVMAILNELGALEMPFLQPKRIRPKQ